MKSWILSSDSKIASTKRLVRALQNSKYETEVLNPLDLHFEFGRQGPRLYLKGQLRKDLPDLVWPRLGWGPLEVGCRLAAFFEMIRIPVINSSQSIREASDKLLSLQLLTQEGLPIPQTRSTPLGLASEFHLFESRDAHVFKTLQGSQGFGVSWQMTRSQSQALIDTFRTAQTAVLVQELVQESFGEDVRAFVIQETVVTAIHRRGSREDLRSNLHQGGTAQMTTLSPQETELVLKASQVFGATYAGVDFLRTSEGPLLLEVNPCPGFQGISDATGLDLAQVLVNSLI
jgi:ribosomal protein S6--L-glutamate ligase